MLISIETKTHKSGSNGERGIYLIYNKYINNNNNHLFLQVNKWLLLQVNIVLLAAEQQETGYLDSSVTIREWSTNGHLAHGHMCLLIFCWFISLFRERLKKISLLLKWNELEWYLILAGHFDDTPIQCTLTFDFDLSVMNFFMSWKNINFPLTNLSYHQSTAHHRLVSISSNLFSLFFTLPFAI